MQHAEDLAAALGLPEVRLYTNARFAEGEAEREDFSRFYELAINAQPEDLERIINRPIYPSNVPLIR